MKPLGLKLYFSVESYDEKTYENYRNCYDVEKRIVSKLVPQIEDLSKECVKIERSFLIYFPRNKPSKSVMVEPG